MPAFALLSAIVCIVAATSAVAATDVTAVRPEETGSAWTAAELAKLRADVDTFFATDLSVRGAHVGLLAVDTRSGNILYERNGADEFQPASTLKLLVGSFALEKLGPSYRFHTSIERAGDRLVLRAGGDPFLSSNDLANAAQSVANAGVRRANGVGVDATRYDTPPYPAGWVWDDFGYDYAARVSAAALDENVVSYTVSAGAALGAAVRIASGNPLGAASVCPGLVDRATTTAAGTPATIDTQTLRPDCTAVTGSLALGTVVPTSIDVAVADPVEHLRSALRAALADPARGIAVDDDASLPNASPSGAGDATQSVWQHDSEPLRAWLGPSFWIPSDNFVAEQLLCEAGLVASGAPGSTQAGLAAERVWLQTLGIDVATVTLADGSGLSQYDRVTPRVLVAILQHDWNGPNRALVLDSLPLGGVRGTIEGIAGTPAAGRVFAKTGSMSHVRGLAGYLATRRHGAVTFAFSVDDWNGDYGPLAGSRAALLSRIIDE